jgi:hypothetical protein
MNTDDQWIQEVLPPIEKIRLRSEPDYYGISHIIANKLGLDKPPRSFAYWMHGWAVEKNITHPRDISYGGNREDTILVTTKEQEMTLKEFGYQKAVAVGLPFIYCEKWPQITRRENTLLVMPNHSSAFADHSANQEKYIQEISSLRRYFSKVVVSIHGTCAQKGFWISSLEKYKIPWLVGASTEDKNSLQRMHNLLASFEYMTTNTLGSHVLYSSYLGCKTSIYGQYYEIARKDFIEDPWYKKNPVLLDKHLQLFEERNIRSIFPWFFCHPQQAPSCQEWAKDLIGEKNKVTPQRISELLGWSIRQQVKGYSKLAFEIWREQGLIGYFKGKLDRK